MQSKRILILLTVAVMLFCAAVPALADPLVEVDMTPDQLTKYAGVIAVVDVDKVVEQGGKIVIPFTIYNGSASDINIISVAPAITSGGIIASVDAPMVYDDTLLHTHKCAKGVLTANAANLAQSSTGYSAVLELYYSVNGVTSKAESPFAVIKTSPKTSSGGSGGGSPAPTIPSLLIEGYTVSMDRIYAGDIFELTLNIKNISESKSISNIRVSVSEPEKNTVLPSAGGSSTAYIKTIKKNSEYTHVVSLQTAPDAEATTYNLSVKLEYGSVSDVQTISIPISQRIRVTIDEPVTYGDAFEGSSLPMYFALYNKGKSSIYNVSVNVEGDGLSMEEGFFGGNITSGSTMRADFNIITAIAGDIQGKVIVTYEDAYGIETVEEKPFTLYVMSAGGGVDIPSPEFPDGKPIDEYPGEEVGGNSGGTGWILWAVIGVVLAGGIITLIAVLRKKRQKELEDV